MEEILEESVTCWYESETRDKRQKRAQKRTLKRGDEEAISKKKTSVVGKKRSVECS
jgi:hypothetical protein